MANSVLQEKKYSQLYQKFIKNLSPKIKYVFERRFGIKTENPETLEAIGKTLGITRERVRQIEEAGFNFIKKNYPQDLGAVFSDFNDYFKEWGGVRKEERVLEELGGKKQKPYVLFFLSIGDSFSKVCGKQDYYSFWSNLPNPKEKTIEILNLLVSELKSIASPIEEEDFYKIIQEKYSLNQKVLSSYLEISKKIQKGLNNQIGLIEWPEIKPRGIKDRAYLVLKREKKPLHFTEVANLIAKLAFNPENKKVHPQTVHNELIKDPRFVLVGRGTYALADWGYSPGTVKDVIIKILKENQKPLAKDEIVEKVLAQRLVSKNTVLMNLNNKEYFTKDENNKYYLRKVETL